MTDFPASYAAARDRFRALSAARGGHLEAHKLAAPGAWGEALTIDVARFGTVGARRAMLSISGTHGQEAMAGSAAQCAFLERDGFAVPDGIQVVLVHALNPWGFSHGLRGDMDNVDLSRNFIDFDAGPPPANPVYAALHEFGAPDVWDDHVHARLDAAIARSLREVGPSATLTGITGGQYAFPTGLNYGGRAPTAAHLILRDLCRRHLGAAERLAYLDWHTGLGAYGDLFFVCPSPPDSPELALARAWFDHPTIGESGRAFQTGGTPSWRGLVIEGLRRFLPGAAIVGGIIEFGTFGNREIGEALLIDRWLRFGRGPDDPALRASLRRTMLDRLNPPDPAWRAGVMRSGADLHARALSGLAHS